jgi:hypothetical protein
MTDVSVVAGKVALTESEENYLQQFLDAASNGAARQR